MKILVADDSAVLRAAVTKLLEPAGYDVVVAEDGVEAITKFYEEDPDLVLLDIQMPKLNGYVVCRLIKEDPAAAKVPVMILTVRDSAEDRYWGVKSGADGYLTKDRLGDEVVQAINSALASSALRDLSRDESSAPPMKHETDVLTRVCEMLDRKLFEATVVNEITAVATRPVGVRATVQEILSSVGRLVEGDAAGLVMAEEGQLELHSARTLDAEDVAGFRTLCDQHLHDLGGGAALPAELNVDVMTLDDSQDVADAKGWQTFHGVPLRSRGELIGVLVLGSHEPGAFGEAVHRTLRTITPSIVSVLESARNFQRNLESEAMSTFSQLG
jgi:twitching motility two-component system response regulator PilH